MRPAVTYKTCATSSREKTVNIIMFTQFEEGNKLSKTRNNAESGDKSDENSLIPPLLNEEEMDAMNSGDESDHDSSPKSMALMSSSLISGGII